MAGNADIDQSRIDETLSAYRELQSQFERLRDRLRLAEENRHTVNRRIYDKVRAEYDRELDSIRARMSPLRTEFEKLRARLEESVREAKAGLAAVEEEQAEAAFRHTIGEYSPAVIAEKQSDLDARLAGARATLDQLQLALASLDAVQNADAANTAPEDLADEPAPAVAAAEAPRRPVLRAADLTPPTKSAPTSARTAPAAPAPGDQFENPQDWIGEVGGDPLQTPRSAPPAGRRESAPAANPSPVATAAPQYPSAPSLVFVGGSHAGQSIPLLPTTLTIGREHDNNIEIKDAEVARYHARILHERGSYVVEDLESTTGTWVNGKRVRRAVLNQGDVIRVGQTDLAIDFEWATGAN